MKKILLEGRKRIGELGSSDAVLEKKAQLIAMQEAHKPSAAPIPQIPLNIPVPKKVERPIINQPELPLQHGPLTVEFVVSQFIKIQHKLERMGTRNVRRLTWHKQSEHMVKEMREVLRQKEAEGFAVGYSHVENMRMCQQFIDDVRHELAQKGLQLNPLTVVVKS